MLIVCLFTLHFHSSTFSPSLILYTKICKTNKLPARNSLAKKYKKKQKKTRIKKKNVFLRFNPNQTHSLQIKLILSSTLLNLPPIATYTTSIRNIFSTPSLTKPYNSQSSYGDCTQILRELSESLYVGQGHTTGV